MLSGRAGASKTHGRWFDSSMEHQIMAVIGQNSIFIRQEPLPHWTEAGIHFRNVYSLLASLKIINHKIYK